MIRGFVLFVSFLICGWACAAPQIESLQPPAWLIRGGVTSALELGLEIQRGDVLQSGTDGRVLVRLRNGARLHMAGQTRVGIWVIEVKQEATEGETAKIEKLEELGILVATGTIRLENPDSETTAARAISAQAAEISFIVRNGDVYASVQTTATLCSLAGQTLLKVKGKLLSIQEPNSCYRENRVTADDVGLSKRLAQQVALKLGGGTTAMNRGGRKLVLGSPNAVQEAEDLRKQLNIKGYAATIEPIKIKGKQHYRVVVGSLLDAAEAQGLADRITLDFPTLHPWSTF
jgi:SPOR domain